MAVIDTSAVNRNPSHPQIRAGNYRMAHGRIHALPITIETPAGAMRRGVGRDGKPWAVRMKHNYGYIKGTEGADGDHVDCYVGPHHKSPLVYIVDQKDADTGRFDEHKCLIGFASAKQAKNAYLAGFSDGRGNDRIGHITELTVAQFRDWLKNHDTRKPHHRASGGRIPHMADGGAPNPFDSFDGESKAANPFDQFNPADAMPQPHVDHGAWNAAGRGVAQGATFNFSDELRGLSEAGGLKPDEPASLGSLVRGTVDYFRGDDAAVARYNAAVARERAENKAAQEQHPYSYGAGEIAGSVPSMALLPGSSAVRGAGLGTEIVRGAQVGAEYGGLSGLGEGEDVASRAMNAATGIVGGIIGGAVAPAITRGASWAYDKFGRPIVNAVRGGLSESEAPRRLATALAMDQDDIAAGKVNGMTFQSWQAAKQRGEPVTLADLGAGRTQSLLRSAANTSPEGRAALEKTFNERFEGQTERVGDEVRGLVAGGANAGKTADQLVAEYDLSRKPAYAQSFREGDREIMSPEIERLMGSPTFVDAMRRATVSGKDRAINEGFGAFNPGVVVENGMVKFKPKPNGVPTYPNLQFWDATKRELDDVAKSAARAGNTEQSTTAGQLAKTLRGELDAAVPSYARTRGIAAQFFGEKDALEAGRTLAGKRVDPQTISAVMRKMNPAERDLFREGYASDWAGRIIGEMRDSRDITKAMFNSPNERKRAEIIFGPQGMQAIHARMTLETIMNAPRVAMGNSTTARQLIEAGLAGGIGAGAGAYEFGAHPTSMIGGALAGVGAAHTLGKLATAGVNKLVGYVDHKTAARVAELLTSDDPTKLRQGLAIASKNQKIAEGLRSIANRMTLAGQPHIPRILITRTQGAVAARAGDEQQKPGGEIHQ